MSIYDQILPANVVSDALAATVEAWIEEYLREIERQWAVTDVLPVFASYNVRPETERWVEEALPALIFVIPGLADTPKKDGEGNYTAPFRVGAAIFSQGQSKALTDRNNKLYAAAVRAILLQQSSLGGLSDGISWDGEDYDMGPPNASRTIGSAVVNFTVYVPGVVNKLAGPLEPTNLDHVGAEWPLAESAFLQVEKEE